MIRELISLIREHPSESFAILAGLVVLASVFVQPAWWGERSQGVLVGAAVLVVSFFVVVFFVSKVKGDVESFATWVLVVVPIVTALLLRKASGLSGVHLPLVRFNIPLPLNPSPQQLMLLFDGLILLVFVVALIRSLSRGESISIESHWGGLGGGLAGWRLSAPLIYLLAIASLLAISSAVAWRIFPAPTPSSQQVQQPQPPVHPATTAGTSSPASGTQNH